MHEYGIGVHIRNDCPFSCSSFAGLSRDEARCTVRFSLGRYNTAEDVQAALRNISNALSEIGERGLTQPRDHASPLVAGEEARL
jgi:selenocysteine lyase/cysteine desulfurase